jgi:uncharacterized membrane protein
VVPLTKSTATRTRLEPNIAALLCYVLWWASGLVFFFIEKNEFVRFHALQSILTFSSLNIMLIVLGWIPFIGSVLAALVCLLSLILWIILMLKAYQGERFKLPVAGDWAERQLSKAKL